MDPRDDSTAKKKVSGIFLSSFSVIIQSEPVTIKQNESVLGYAVANISTVLCKLEVVYLATKPFLLNITR